jgi:membrane-associated phospholipid phosphatase
MSGPINPPHKTKSLAQAGTSASPINTADTLTLASARPLYAAYSIPTAPNRNAMRVALNTEIAQLQSMGDELYAGVIRSDLQQVVNLAAKNPNRMAWHTTHGIPAYTVSGMVGSIPLSHDTVVRVASEVYADAGLVNSSKGPVGTPADWWKLVEAEDLAPFFAIIAALNLKSNTSQNKLKCTGALIDVVSGVALDVVMRLKNRMQVPRPAALAGFTPLIDSPLHSSFPGGHSTVTHAVVTVIRHLLNDTTAALPALADATGLRRVQAGLHTPFDTSQGKALGIAIGSFLVSALGATGSPYAQWPALFAMASQDWE